MKLALFDMGSNSVRLLLGEYKDGTWHNGSKRLWTTRLGKTKEDGSLTELAKNATIEAFKEGKKLAAEFGTSELRALATGAVRQAPNGKDFAKEVYKKTGVKVKILSGEEEANIGFVGAVQDKPNKGKYMMIDIGGATTEFAIGTKTAMEELISLPIGAVRFKEKSEIDMTSVDKACNDLWPQILINDIDEFVGIGGTFTTMAAMDLRLKTYDPEKVHNHKITRDWILRQQESLRELTFEELVEIPGLSLKRAEIIIAGVDIIASLMNRYDINEISISEKDGLEGAQSVMVSSLRNCEEKEIKEEAKKKAHEIELCALNTIKEHEMISANDNILIACSGGPDSMSLLYILNKYKETLGISSLGAICLDHGIRIQGLAEKEMVEKYCLENDIKFHGYYEDIVQMAEDEKISVETAGRKLRYALFESLCTANGYKTVALGHHKGDQAETVLAHILRGSGITGIKGMEYYYQGKIRPLLDITKDELQEYVNLLNIPYAWDHTNDELDYERNRLRLDVIPKLKEFNPKIMDALSRLGELASLDDYYLEEESLKALDTIVISQENVENSDKPILVLDKNKFKKMPKAIRYRVWRNICKKYFPFGAMASLDNIKGMDKLNFLDTNKQFLLKWMKIYVQYDKIYIAQFLNGIEKIFTIKDEEKENFCEPKDMIKTEVISELPKSLENGSFIIPEYLAREEISVRKREPGDLFILRNSQGYCIGHKKLKKYLIDKKVPVAKRDSILWLAIGKKILGEARLNKTYLLKEENCKKYVLGYF